MTYYKLENNALIRAKSVEKINGVWKSNPTAEQYAKIEAYPRSEESFAPPKCDEGFHAVADGYKVEDGKWVKKWRVEAITYTEADYDAAMEYYIRQVRVERGYTLREPSDYKDDPHPRFAQDAEDFIAFRSAVMLYALPILNKYKNDEDVPTLEEFKAGFPKMVWTLE